MNAKKILEWVKSNVVSVIFFVLMVAALIVLPILAKKMSGGVQTVFKERVNAYKKVGQLEKTKVDNETMSGTVLVNEQLLDRYRAVMEAEARDADRVVEMAETHNRKGRSPIMSGLFPAPAASQREIMPKRFHEALEVAYEDLLERINAGAPPTADALQAAIAQAERQFRAQVLQRDQSEALNDEETARLKERLTAERIQRYASAADRINVYADALDLNVPVWIPTSIPSLGELYDWQWKYWITEDVLMAIDDANTSDGGEKFRVQGGPVKRLLGLEWLSPPVGSSSGSGAGAPAGGNAPGMSGGGGGRRGGGAGTAPNAAPSGVVPNPATPIKLDFAGTFTGRTSNSLYDVQFVGVTLVVDTARLPRVLDAFARRNFITVTDLSLRPAEPYEAAQAGYLYGPDPVSIVRLELETIWLRTWMREFMPTEVKQALGVGDPPKPGAMDEDA